MSLKYKNILIIGDSKDVIENIYEIFIKKGDKNVNYSFACSPESHIKSAIGFDLEKIDIKKEKGKITNKYDLIISAHCKQIFPGDLIKDVKCINIHPGFSPYNRGWYPHVFSIINKLPAGVTIHEMDNYIDHGPIIVQKKIQIRHVDTSESLYARILELEKELFSEAIGYILAGNYETFLPEEGNINYKKDFIKLREIDLEKKYSGRDMIDLLRALTHGDYKNAYFFDDSRNKIFIQIKLEREHEAF